MRELKTTSYIKNVGPLPADLLVNGEPMLLKPGEELSITFVQRDKMDEIEDLIRNTKA